MFKVVLQLCITFISVSFMRFSQSCSSNQS